MLIGFPRACDLQSVNRLELVNLVTEVDAFFLSTTPAIAVTPAGTR